MQERTAHFEQYVWLFSRQWLANGQVMQVLCPLVFEKRMQPRMIMKAAVAMVAIPSAVPIMKAVSLFDR